MIQARVGQFLQPLAALARRATNRTSNCVTQTPLLSSLQFQFRGQFTYFDRSTSVRISKLSKLSPEFPGAAVQCNQVPTRANKYARPVTAGLDGHAAMAEAAAAERPTLLVRFGIIVPALCPVLRIECLTIYQIVTGTFVSLFAVRCSIYQDRTTQYSRSRPIAQSFAW